MTDTNMSLMTVIEKVANEMFEKYLLARLETVVNEKINAYSRQVASAVGELDNVKANVEPVAAIHNMLVELTGRMNMAYKELENLQRAVGVTCYESSGAMYQGNSVLSMLYNTATATDLEKLTDRVDEMDSPKELIRSEIEDAIDAIDWGEKVNENLDMDEIVADLDVSSAVDSYMEGLDFSEALRNSGVDWNEVLDDYMESVLSRLSISYTHE